LQYSSNQENYVFPIPFPFVSFIPEIFFFFLWGNLHLSFFSKERKGSAGSGIGTSSGFLLPPATVDRTSVTASGFLLPPAANGYGTCYAGSGIRTHASKSSPAFSSPEVCFFSLGNQENYVFPIPFPFVSFIPEIFFFLSLGKLTPFFLF